MGTMASQITSLTSVYSVADQRKHQSSASLTFMRGIHRGPVISPHKWPVTWKMFPFDHVIMKIKLRPFRVLPMSSICNIANFERLTPNKLLVILESIHLNINHEYASYDSAIFCVSCVQYPLAPEARRALLLIYLTYIRVCISNYINVFLWDVSTYPCPNWNEGLTKPPLKSGHGRLIASRSFTWMWLLLHAIIPISLHILSVSKRGHMRTICYKLVTSMTKIPWRSYTDLMISVLSLNVYCWMVWCLHKTGNHEQQDFFFYKYRYDVTQLDCKAINAWLIYMYDDGMLQNNGPFEYSNV